MTSMHQKSNSVKAEPSQANTETAPQKTPVTLSVVTVSLPNAQLVLELASLS